MIERHTITNTLPNGILEEGQFVPDALGLALHMNGYYTLPELAAILEDFRHVNAVYVHQTRS